jgi:hypothetical protein
MAEEERNFLEDLISRHEFEASNRSENFNEISATNGTISGNLKEVSCTEMNAENASKQQED